MTARNDYDLMYSCNYKLDASKFSTNDFELSASCKTCVFSAHIDDNGATLYVKQDT